LAAGSGRARQGGVDNSGSELRGWQRSRNGPEFPGTNRAATAGLPEDPIEPVRAVIRAVGQELDKPIRPLSTATAGAIGRFVNLLPEMPPQMPEFDQMLPEFLRPKQDGEESEHDNEKKKTSRARLLIRHVS
jgi:hypothetical protein